MSDQPPIALEYENPQSAAPAISGLVRSAKIMAWTGFVLPFIGLGGVVMGIMAWSFKSLPFNLRRQGRNAAMLGLLAVVVNSVICVELLFPSRRSPALYSVVKCSSNLRQIGLAIMLYANENADQLPPNFKTLILTQDITSDLFICPQSKDIDGYVYLAKPPTTQQVAASVVEGTSTCSYFYYPFPNQQLSKLTTSHVLAYEKTTNHAQPGGYQGMNILFADGHVEWFNAPASQKILQELSTGQNPPPSAP